MSGLAKARGSNVRTRSDAFYDLHFSNGLSEVHDVARQDHLSKRDLVKVWNSGIGSSLGTRYVRVGGLQEVMAVIESA